MKTCPGFNSTGSGPGQGFLSGIVSMGEADKGQSVHHNANNWISTPTVVGESVLTRSIIPPSQMILRSSDILEPQN